jgi:hypothetical protein
MKKKRGGRPPNSTNRPNKDKQILRELFNKKQQLNKLEIKISNLQPTYDTLKKEYELLLANLN